jgi:hypothetical protein
LFPFLFFLIFDFLTHHILRLSVRPYAKLIEDALVIRREDQRHRTRVAHTTWGQITGLGARSAGSALCPVGPPCGTAGCAA